MDDIKTQNLILSKAKNLLKSTPSGSFTMDLLASELKMSKKTLYIHFSSKNDLLNALLENFFNEINQLVDPIFESDIPPLDKWRKFLFVIQSQVSTINFLVSLSRDHPFLWVRIQEFRMSKLEKFKDIFIEAQNRGELRDGVDPEIAYHLLITIISNFLVPDVILNLNYSFKEITEQIFDIFSHGINKERNS